MMDAYAQTGVDISEGNRAVSLMKSAVISTHDARVLAGIGAFGGMFDGSALKLMDHPVLVASTDGVGTKTKVAATMGRWDSIGQDLVNHCVNDILVQGARPLFFMDYLAASKLDAEKVAIVVTGIAKACRENSTVLLGGETAEMPGVYVDGQLDLAGTIVGVVDRAQAIDGSQVEVGDVIIGLPSSGLHTNGYSLARHVLGSLDWGTTRADLGETVGTTLLRIHRSYLQQIAGVMDAGIPINGMAHITGGGFIENVPRMLPSNLAAEFNLSAWPIPPIFELIQTLGNVSQHAMFRTFNMGLGLIIALSPKDAERALVAAGEGFIVGTISHRLGEAVKIV